MIDNRDGKLFMHDWEDWQYDDYKVKENKGSSSAERVRRFRQREAEKRVTRNGDVTLQKRLARASDSEADSETETEVAKRVTSNVAESDMERICREAAERHPNRDRSATADQVCRALISNGHSDADSLAKFAEWSGGYAHTDSKFCGKLLDLISRQVYMISPKREESIYPDFTPGPNGVSGG